MRHLLALVLLGVGAHPSATLDAQSRPLSSGPPLRANVWFDEYAGLASFDINRPAHVAIFALRPLGNIELIYPVSGWGGGVKRAFRTGRHSVRAESHRYQLVRGRAGHGRSRYASGQTYILLIASDRPLDLRHFLATGTVPWLNHPSVTRDPLLATDHLAREIVAGQGRSEWTAAYHVIWPEASLRRYDGRVPVTMVRCPGGAVIAIPKQVLRPGGWICPDRHTRPPVSAHPRSPRVPTIIDMLPKRPGATPTRGRTLDRRLWPRPAPRPGVTPRVGTPPRVGPVKKVVPRPKIRPRPKAKPKKNGGG